MDLSSRARFSVWAWLAALVALSAGGIACYRPTIGDATLRCSTGGVCPDGFRCGGANLCYQIGRDGGIPPLSDAGDAPVDQAVDTAPDMGADVPDANPDRPDGSDAEVGCFMPKPNCTPSDAGMCDPYCQTGCSGCNRKCSVNTRRELTCAESNGSLGPMARCQTQTDNCQPGLVCLEDACGVERCHQFCRSDSDCTNAPCTWDVGAGQRACDKPFVDTCVPLPGSANTGCGGGNSVCYLSTSHPNRTVCDCIGETPANDPCQRSRDCLLGLVCVDPNGEGTVCLRVCRLAGPDSDCPAGQVCKMYRGSNPNNDAHSTYGYCFFP